MPKVTMIRNSIVILSIRYWNKMYNPIDVLYNHVMPNLHLKLWERER